MYNDPSKSNPRMYGSNADGSTKLPLLIIGKAYKPHLFGNKTDEQLGFNYQNNTKVWMTAILYQEWLLDWDWKLRDERRNILLLQDNFPGHIVPNSLMNIKVENFKPNLTVHIQPNDQGIIQCFKAYYRAQFISRAGILPDLPLSHAQPTVPILSLVHAPDIVINPITHFETLVENALDKLEATWALQCSNCMAIAELLNLAFESHNILDATDKEICKSVMGAKTLRETRNDNNGDDNNISAPGPTWNEALQAALVLRKASKILNSVQIKAIPTGLGYEGVNCIPKNAETLLLVLPVKMT
ncbi:hypothetical protein SERLA73DRAFT_155982 [Serpula lacrymans var. lacrymans S7.3]|uniref:DDE-1 domain-containing protein n=1 Tax=Serpula lacrymans var. lacrymans (strain S7.3) TaxID=936435 RepID=F8QCF0_SERL3|nr:hypothetical protein SERLA73DRAFT_155982 [Serpula lacrymans var. lacrymans S7.3]